MSRKLKPLKAGTVMVENFEEEVTVYLDRNRKDMFATVFGEIVRAPSFEEIEEKVNEIGTRGPSMTWKKYVIADVNIGMYSSPFMISLRIEKVEVGTSEDGKTYERSFRNESGDEDYRKPDEYNLKIRDSFNDVSPYDGSYRLNPREGHYVLDYTPELWNNLRSLQEAIKVLRNRIGAVVSSPEDLKRLVATMPKQIEEKRP